MTLLFFLCFVGDFFVVARRTNAHIRQVCCAFRSSHASKSPHKTAKRVLEWEILGLLLARQMLTYVGDTAFFFNLSNFINLTNQSFVLFVPPKKNQKGSSFRFFGGRASLLVEVPAFAR